MTTRNVEHYVDEAITSVLDQTYGDFELLVSDDGSSDGTVDRARRFAAADDRVRLLHHEPGGGAGGNRNFAMAHAQAEWIVFLDSDDFWTPDRLELSLAAVEAQPDSVIAFGDYHRFEGSVANCYRDIFDGRGFFDRGAPHVLELLGTRNGKELFSLDPRRLLRFCCLYYCPISTNTVTLRHEVARRNGIRFREDWQINEDFDVWMRMLEHGACVGIRSALAYYRYTPGSLTSDPIRYAEGMARSHGEWLTKLGPQLTREDLETYRSKVAGFYEAAAWARAQRGHVRAAVQARRNADRVRGRRPAVLGLARTAARALWSRCRRSVRS